MATLKVSQFSQYELTESETLAGSILSQEQIYVIQNLISSIAAEKLALKFTPESPLEFAQREAELQGQIGILTYLLDVSENTTNAVNHRFNPTEE